MSKILLSMVLILASGALSCQTKTEPLSEIGDRKLLRHYNVLRTPGGQTQVRAYFYADGLITVSDEAYGTAIRPDGTSRIDCNNTPMAFEQGFFSGAGYAVGFDEWPGNFTFTWIDGDGKAHVDRIAMEGVGRARDWLVATGEGPAAVVREGSPVRPGETLTVRTPEKEGHRNVWSTSEVGARQIVLAGEPYSPLSTILPALELQRTLIRREGGCARGEVCEGGNV